MSVSIESIIRSKAMAAYARDNLTLKNDSLHYAKVCFCCDHKILYGDESNVKLTDLKEIAFLFSKSVYQLDRHPNDVKTRIHAYYTPRFEEIRRREFRWLKTLYLSPRSYLTKVGKVFALGCCSICKSSITSSRKSDRNAKLPKFAIANGLMIGEAPEELTDLNEVEVAMISLARVDKHVFSVYGGAHKQMVGWHSMYANDISAVSKGINWCEHHLDDDDNSNEEQELSDEEDGNSEDESEADEDSDLDETEDALEDQTDEEKQLRFAEICVILTGPFTREQLALAHERTRVNWGRLQIALEWLKANNPFYAEKEITRDCLVEPIFLEKVEDQVSTNSNVEKTFEFTAVFADGTNADVHNGGCATRKGFKQVTLERMLEQSGQREARIISRPTRNLLSDYQGDNLMMAFPLQFPYGIGSKNAEGEHRSGIGHLKHLAMMSVNHFHRADFLCVLHNMFERQRMVQNSYLRHTVPMAVSYTELTNQEMGDAVNRFTSGVSGSSVADLFLNKMKAVSKSMAHTHEAAKQARQNIFAMLTKFGLPAALVTVTPKDEDNFRIKIYADCGDGISDPPDENADEKVIRDFLVDTRKLRIEYPGFCALDYENVMRIVIEHLLGWDMKKHCNKSDEGIFGDVLAYVVATEEQGRKTLHGHILVWLTQWKCMMEGLCSENESIKQSYCADLKTFASRIMTCDVFGPDVTKITRPCNDNCSSKNLDVGQRMVKCDNQDVRNLRSKCGTTSIGMKAIAQCEDCKGIYTSEDFAIAKLIRFFGKQRICDEGIMPTFEKGFWERNQVMTKAFQMMEICLMNQTVPHKIRRTRKTAYCLDESMKVFNAIARNLHKSAHVGKCFKEKGDECRMKIPSAENAAFNVVFNEDETSWFTWDGTEKKRYLYVVVPRRSHFDMFGNIYSAPISEVFACNSNVVACVDGGSPMYITAYHSKNTQKEDSKKSGQAAMHMVKKIRERLEEEETTDTQETNEEGGKADRYSAGLRAMIGAVLMSTNAHICSAPMASHIIRNESRFRYSHDHKYTRLKDFLEAPGRNATIGTDEEGTPFMKDSVADYVYRPKELENCCLYEFLSNYVVARPTKSSMKWHGDHPSRQHLQVSKMKRQKIPLINFMDFPDTKFFEGNNLVTENIPHEKKAAHVSMEEYCTKACLAFVPFRSVNDDLKIDGSFHRCFQQFVLDGRLSEEHKNVLQNIQDCRNSFNAGRPVDVLERETTHKYKGHKNPGDIADDVLDNVISDILCEESTFDDFLCPNYRDSMGRICFKSTQTTQLGSYKCGTEHCTKPNIIESQSVVVNSTNNMGISGNGDVGENGNFGDTLYNTQLFECIITMRERITDPDTGFDVPNPNGHLDNLREYADVIFKKDEDQCHAFVCIVAYFILKLYNEAKGGNIRGQATKRRKFENNKSSLANLVKGDQLICALCGAGGSGKSHVIKTIVKYCKRLCENLKIRFDRRSIVVTALSGAAAVSINGETTHSAAILNGNVKNEHVEEWKNSYLLIVDEIGFGGKKTLETLNDRLRELREESSLKFGGMHVVFAGDFSQLKPVRQSCLYDQEDCPMWEEWVHTFFELRTNHRFAKDKKWGNLLLRFREKGPTPSDVDRINTRLIDSEHGPKSESIPHDAAYATKTNVDRMAINDGIFAKHLEATHSKDSNVLPPKHTICIKAANPEWHKVRQEYVKFNRKTKDIFYCCVGEAHVKSRNNSKTYDPLLKLYAGRPVMINDNIDVKCGLANGTLGKFRQIELKEGVTWQNLEKIVIDGYHVWLADVSQIECMKLGIGDGQNEKLVEIRPKEKISVAAKYPLPIYGEISKYTPRFRRNMRMTQFPLNVADARTIHKLQGASIDKMVISSWKYGDNWIYVALSRVRELKNLYIRRPLNYQQCKGMDPKLRQFMERLREKA